MCLNVLPAFLSFFVTVDVPMVSTTILINLTKLSENVDIKWHHPADNHQSAKKKIGTVKVYKLKSADIKTSTLITSRNKGRFLKIVQANIIGNMLKNKASVHLICRWKLWLRLYVIPHSISCQLLYCTLSNEGRVLLENIYKRSESHLDLEVHTGIKMLNLIGFS